MVPQRGLIVSVVRRVLQDAPPRPGWVLVLVLIRRRGDDRQLDFVGIGVNHEVLLGLSCGSRCESGFLPSNRVCEWPSCFQLLQPYRTIPFPGAR